MTASKLSAPGYIVLTCVTRKIPNLVPLPLIGVFQSDGYCLVTSPGRKEHFPVAESLEEICELLKQEHMLRLELERKMFYGTERTATEANDAEQKPSDVPAAAAGNCGGQDRITQDS